MAKIVGYFMESGIPDGCGFASYPHPLGYVPMIDTRYLILA